MSLIRIGILAFALLPISARPALADDDPQMLQPSSDWILDYADDSCALQRTFGEGEDTVFMEMRAFGAGNGFQFRLYGEGLSTRRSVTHFRYHPDAEGWEIENAQLLDFPDGRKGVQFMVGLIPPPAADETDSRTETDDWWRERSEQVTGLTVGGSLEEPVSLHFVSLGAPFEALDACVDELRTHWGIDVEAHRNLTRAAQPVNQRFWYNRVAQLYPRYMLQRGVNAALRVRVIVGTNGRVEECAVQAGISNDVFDEQACDAITRHGRFEPALDANGDPIRSVWGTTVIYTVR